MSNEIYVRVNTKSGLQYIVHARCHQLLLEYMNLPGDFIRLESAAREKNPIVLHTGQIEAFWLSTPEDRQAYDQYVKEVIPVDTDEPWRS